MNESSKAQGSGGSFLDRLAANPRSFTWLRKILEADFYAVRRVVRRDLGLTSRCRILDLGCGAGELAGLFREHDYLGLDLSRRYIAYARERFGGMRFGVSDAAALPLRNDSCDRVLVFGVLHHMDDPLAQRVVLEIARVLRPGGLFLLLEDRREVAAWNLPGRMIHSLDAGDHIRDREGYLSLIPPGLFHVERLFAFVSGICEYYGFLLRREAPRNRIDLPDGREVSL
jgi:SAM-dependent methyltransferase